ncbi:MAG: hypothetical protein J1F07_06860 [Muribaculaceae bacterium]|nr:hypothetical protein [Muribaculaceae bacterium]
MNKTSKSILFALAALLALATPLSAQNISTPYSMYGYGILGDRATSMQRQMGSVGYAMHSGRQINVMNPASYASIDSLTFLFDIGADLTFLWSKEGKTKENSIGGGLDYVTLQFPIAKHFGASIGMLPYSGVGYAFGNDIAHGARENQGSGGINMAYLGFAANYFGLGLGLNVSYNFGTIINDVYVTPSTGGQFLSEHVMEIRDWDVNVGLQYTLPVSKFDAVTLGATYSPKKSLHGKSWVTTQEVQMEARPDTVGYLNLSGNYFTPNSFGVGVNYLHEKVSRLMVEFDFTYQLWSQVKYSEIKGFRDPMSPSTNPDVVFAGMDFSNRMRLGLGGEFVPKVRGSYMERVAYRLGGYFCNDYLNILGNRVREYGLTCGFGFHTPQDKTVINVGFEWKHRTTTPSVLISENYFNITLGLNFNELWFWQRKIR